MPIIASCGHEATETETVRYHSEHCDAVEGFVPCVVYAEYCSICAIKARTWPEYLPTNEAADNWLANQHTYGAGSGAVAARNRGAAIT